MTKHQFKTVTTSWLLCVAINMGVFHAARISYRRTDIDFDGPESAENTVKRTCSFGQQLYVENRANCNRFFVCNDENGRLLPEPMLGVCPPDMWFDPYHSDTEVVCVHPEELCAADHTDAYRYCNCASTHSVGKETPARELDPLIEKSTVCIVDNQLHLYGSKKDCERYFACHNEKVFRFQCKPGMHFNAAKGYCDQPKSAACKVHDAACPPIGMAFLPHPRKCNMFYYCLFGQKLQQTCEFFYVWDPEQQQCVPGGSTSCAMDD